MLAWTEARRVKLEGPDAQGYPRLVRHHTENGYDEDGLVPDLVELGKLKLKLRLKKVAGEWRVYSVDHQQLYLVDTTTRAKRSCRAPRCRRAALAALSLGARRVPRAAAQRQGAQAAHRRPPLHHRARV